MLENIPEELRALPQWVNADRNKIPIDPRTGDPANVVDRSTWSDYETAVSTGLPVGFVFSSDDPYAFIDLDEPHTPTQAARHQKIIDAFPSYTEISQSGRGLHIIVRGHVPNGKRRDRVELYSSDRYAIMTGNVFRPWQITDQQHLISALHAEMGGDKPSARTLQDGPQTLPDNELLQMAYRAQNAQKFMALFNGDWQSFYPSQSEADFALINMLAFYSKNNEQVRRIFRLSELGKREKAQKNDKYIDRALSRYRAEHVAVDLGRLNFTPETLTNRVEPEPTPLPTPPPEPREHVEPKIDRRLARQTDTALPALTLPRGLLGEIAANVYSSAYQPMPEAAVAAAITLCAGIVGRQYNISNTGLNHYTVLLAPTGTGKEAAASGIDRIMKAAAYVAKPVENFMGPSRFSSGQAVLRFLAERSMPCFASVLGEAGFLFEAMYDKRASPSDRALLQIFLDLYMKSGHDRAMRPSAYSDSIKNTDEINSPCFSFLAESAPAIFYDAITEETIAGGLLPRMLVLESEGEPRPPNRDADRTTPPRIVNCVAELAMQVSRMASNRAVSHVPMQAAAYEHMKRFELSCLDRCNGEAEAIRQIWSRCNLKVLRLAALVAVCADPYNPLVTTADCEWAESLVRRGSDTILRKIAAGEVGSAESLRDAAVLSIIDGWKSLRPGKRDNENAPAWSIKQDVWVPLAYIRRVAMRRACFKNAREGAGRALDLTLHSLVLQGQIESGMPGAASGQQLGVAYRRGYGQS